MSEAIATITNCIPDLTQVELDFLNSNLATYKVSQYLEANKNDDGTCNVAASDFAKEAIQVLKDGGEVDFDDQIINKLKDKAKCIYNKLVSSSTSFKNAIKKFDGDFPVSHIKFEIDEAMSSNTRKAFTRAPEDYVIDIVLNGNPLKDASYQKRPNLLVAKTIIHEVIHAEMFRKLLSLANDNGSIDVDLLQFTLYQGDYLGMLDYYYRYGNNINSTWQHQQMAAHYRETIGRVLQEFDTGKVVDDNSQPDQLYLDLAWEGLNHNNLVAWKDALTQEEKDRINQVINNYISQYPNQNCTE
ncbi:hypothetical protein [Hyunsoonleella rubra]|uniref:Uncharacterized protein n=1 Tax=Hyunsoonleella rubra TaxID=1737062 RepID=A0ABW5TF27_9FLAO